MNEWMSRAQLTKLFFSPVTIPYSTSAFTSFVVNSAQLNSTQREREEGRIIIIPARKQTKELLIFWMMRFSFCRRITLLMAMMRCFHFGVDPQTISTSAATAAVIMK